MGRKPNNTIGSAGLSRKTEKSCFVIMPGAKSFNLIFEDALLPAIEACNLAAVRGTEILMDGEIPGQIRKGIADSLVCIADLSGLNRNVVYEVALAHAQNKPVILVTQDSPESLPFDLRHFRIIKYTHTPEGRQQLQNNLSESLKAIIGAPESPTRSLEEMLVPRSLASREGPFVIASSPLSWRDATKLGGGFTKLRKTCSDHVGIRGMIQAFGLIFGLDRLPELLDPGDYVDQVVHDNPANLYCIGSPKVNRWSGLILRELSKRWEPRIEFKADPKSSDLRNIRVMIEIDGDSYTPKNFGIGKTDPFVRDFGIVLRAPHPADPNYMVMVIAGRSSLGSEAVSRAVTDPTHIAVIKRHLELKDVDLTNHKEPFYAIVRMDRDTHEDGSYEAILSSFEIVEVASLERLGR